MDSRLSASLEHAKQTASARRRAVRKKAVETGAVIYFVQAGKHIKVGISSRGALKGRINAIQIGNPYEVRLLKLLKTSQPRKDERVFHRLLKRYHVRGEWFLIDNRAILELLGATVG